jgi:predicted dehydrogenase
MDIAIVTGASSGLGVAFVRALLKEYKNLDEIWVVARRKERLCQLKSELGNKLHVIALDLIKPQSIAEFEQTLCQQKPNIKILINNAGFGKLDYFKEMPYSLMDDMIELNCRALTDLISVCLKYMQKNALILNVSSIAAFAPNTRLTVYSATKSFILSLSRGLRKELRPQKINVLAVCPGPMSTEFLSVANITAGRSKAFDKLPYCNPEKVALGALKKAKKGGAIYTPRIIYKLYYLLAKFLPMELAMNIGKA